MNITHKTYAALMVVGICMLCVGAPSLLNAQIVSVVGQAQIISPPASTLLGAVIGPLQNGFNEQQNVLLGVPVAIDQGVIPSGTVINSHMIFSESGGYSNSTDATWTFSSAIIGVMSDNRGVNEVASTPYIGWPATIYPTNPFTNRGIESPNDFYSFVGNTLSFHSHVVSTGDWIRVVTQGENVGVPEPSTYLMIGSFLAIALHYHKKRRPMINSCL